jgi:hypothetical protein
MTIQELINQAFFELEIVEAGSSADATDSADAMTILNQMLAAWKVSYMDLGWFAQDDLTATSPLPEWAEEGVISNLALKLASAFNAPVSAELAVKAREGRNLIARTLINLNLEGADMSHMAQGSVNSRYNIQTDT